MYLLCTLIFLEAMRSELSLLYIKFCTSFSIRLVKLLNRRLPCWRVFAHILHELYVLRCSSATILFLGAADHIKYCQGSC